MVPRSHRPARRSRHRRCPPTGHGCRPCRRPRTRWTCRRGTSLDAMRSPRRGQRTARGRPSHPSARGGCRNRPPRTRCRRPSRPRWPPVRGLVGGIARSGEPCGNSTHTTANARTRLTTSLRCLHAARGPVDPWPGIDRLTVPRPQSPQGISRQVPRPHPCVSNAPGPHPYPCVGAVSPAAFACTPCQLQLQPHAPRAVSGSGTLLTAANPSHGSWVGQVWQFRDFVRTSASAGPCTTAWPSLSR